MKTTTAFAQCVQGQIARIQKYKNLCRRHYYRADNYKTKHLAHEFQMQNK